MINLSLSLPALLTELVHSVVGKYIYNFQPLLTRTEVRSCLWFEYGDLLTQFGLTLKDRGFAAHA